MSKTMLDKIGIIGDVKTAFNRLGIETLAVVCIGGTNGTPVKVQHCDTVGGSYEDFKTLDSGHTSLNKGFTFSLEGAKKFVKIVGCDVAVGIVGDCDYDVKKVTFNTVSISGADLENNKAQTINVSTYSAPVEVTPTSGKDGMKKATITLSNIPSGKLYAWQTGGETVYLGYTATATPTTSDTFYLATADGLVEKTIEDVTGSVVSVEIETTESFGRYLAGDIEL